MPNNMNKYEMESEITIFTTSASLKKTLFLQSNQLHGLGSKNSISCSSPRVPKAFILVLSLSKEISYLSAPRRLRITKAHLGTRKTVVSKKEVHNNFDEWCFPYITNGVLRQNNIKLLHGLSIPQNN